MSATNNSLHNWILPAFGLLGLALLFRFFSFFPTVINHDESTYILIAREMLHGRHYFVDVIDTKPIGIFLIYMVFEWIGRDNILLFRVFTALWVGFTAFGLFAIAGRYLWGNLAGWTAGVSYILMTSIFTFYGVSPNTELFFNGFTVLALWWIIGGRQWWRYLLAGGALGIGFMIKYVVAFDALAFGLLTVWLAHQGEQAWWKGIGRGILMLITFVIPFGLAFQYYRLLGYDEAFLYYTFDVPGRYPVDRQWWKMTIFYLDFFLRYLPVSIFAGYALLRQRQVLADYWQFFIGWLLLDLFIIGWPGKNFGHYFIQLMLPVCLLAGVGLATATPFRQWWRRLPKSIRWALPLVGTIAMLLLQKKDYYDKWDHPKEIAAYLASRLSPSDQIYTGNYQQILYFLLAKETPTPFVHRSLLWDAHHRAALEIDLEKETRQILALRPRFLTLENPVPNNLLADSLFQYYRPIHTFRDRITVYERK